MKILLVEDDAIFARALARCLGAHGHSLRMARGGEEALQVLADEGAELVLSDIQMPGMDGIELLRRVRKCFPGTRVVLMTGFGSAAQSGAAFQYRTDGYLQKPIKIEALLKGLQHLEGG